LIFTCGSDFSVVADFILSFHDYGKDVNECACHDVTQGLSYIKADRLLEESKLNFHFRSSDAGVAHADDLRYLFPIHLEWPYTPNDHEVVELMLSLWTNFVKFG